MGKRGIEMMLRRAVLLLLAFCFIFPEEGTARMLPETRELEKLPKDGGEHFNRLVFEKSPYLLQHAQNPIDWYPWGEEAFERARKENRPIFLSIGYSTCHWCHVMERESFEDADVARILNEHFVAIKVDREERPDIDQIYMAVCQALTGSGGWPLTILMTPERKPFFAGTYFPKTSRQGRPGLMDLLNNAARLWSEKREDLAASAERLTGSLRDLSSPEAGEIPDTGIFDTAYEHLRRRYDEKFGGFGTRPKFPIPHQLRFLLQYEKRTGTKEAGEMARKTLGQMRRGGIYDHVGHGFHRYSTDAEWLLPHFEKMLYDQAGLAMAYLDAYQSTRDSFFAETAREIFAYIKREMTDSAGGFYSAQDADSEGEEGKFHVWTRDEILQILGDGKGSGFAKTFQVSPEGNFHDEATGRKTGANILHLAPEAPFIRIDDSTRETLYRHRDQRVHPLRDDKILTAWNGLMIAALARGGRILNEPAYTKAARDAADFVRTRLRDDTGRLLRRFRDGEAALPAYVDDYAFFVWGLLELYETDFNVSDLESAIGMSREMLNLFWDDESGGLHFSGKGNEELIASTKEIYDGALPSGNSVALGNLLRLGRITADTQMEEKAEALARAFAGDVRQAPQAHTQFLLALDFLHGPTREIVIAGKPGAADTKALVDAVRKKYLPNTVVVLRPEGKDADRIGALAEYTRNQSMQNGKATAYVCENYHCKAPVTDPGKLDALL